MQLRVWTLLTLCVTKIKHPLISSLHWHSVFSRIPLCLIPSDYRYEEIACVWSVLWQIECDKLNVKWPQLNDRKWRKWKSFTTHSNYIWHDFHQKLLIHRLAAYTRGTMAALITAQLLVLPSCLIKTHHLLSAANIPTCLHWYTE